MSVKVSQLQQIDELLDTAYLMAVQNGKSVKFLASLLQKKSEAIENASHLNGYSDTDFAKLNANGLNDADLLGGYSASNFATKDDLNRIATNTDDPTWCCPKLWFNASKLPNNDDYNWAWCDGRWLDKTEYADLFDVIGYQFTRDQNTGNIITEFSSSTENKFQIPDLRGRFILGAWAGMDTLNVPQQTFNLPYNSRPTNAYEKDFTTTGQYVYPGECGYMSGDPTTTQDSTDQLMKHGHGIHNNAIGDQSQHSSGMGSTSSPAMAPATITIDTTGSNAEILFQYPANTLRNDNNFNYGMLSMPPYTSFAYCMRIRKQKATE